ncbi:MAG: hypothetical protein KDE27_06740 [Planctomycetes bacterium]|nr:hypothetical protein [Planctomycetota bacterium]
MAFLRPITRSVVALGACALASGCTSGLIYTHTVRPLTTNFNKTPVGERSEIGDVKDLRVYNIEVQWDSNAVGDVARKHGFEELYYADLETLSILGVWTQQWLHLYGK